jgi:serine/threonine-protein phosphatase 2A activator
MTKAEVLGKRVVVQHIPLDGLMEWEPSVDRSSYVHGPRQQMNTTATLGPPGVMQSRTGLSVQSLPTLSRRIR